MSLELSEQKLERKIMNLRSMIFSLIAVAIIYSLFAVIAHSANKWQILFPVSTGCLSPVIGGFILGFTVYDNLKDWLFLSSIFALIVALLNLAVIKGTEVFSFLPYAPAIVLAFGFVCSLMGYGLSIPIRKKA
ncbi:MAG: hypothetical protein HGN29_09815 [Asgard group archaeon]|nr:hypothetical protein [Asgard group archaeon]